MKRRRKPENKRNMQERRGGVRCSSGDWIEKAIDVNWKKTNIRMKEKREGRKFKCRRMKRIIK